MKKLNYLDTQDLQLIDIRTPNEFHAGHAKDSLNFNPSNFKSFAHHFLSLDQAIAFVLAEENPVDVNDLNTLAQEQGYTQIKGYILADEIPAEDCQTSATIPADEFFIQKDDYTLLDLRNPAEITRPAPEANLTNIPLEELAARYQSLDSKKTIYTLCGSGNRATAAASFLTDKGYHPVVIKGGMKAIQATTQA